MRVDSRRFTKRVSAIVVSKKNRWNRARTAMKYPAKGANFPLAKLRRAPAKCTRK